MIRPLENETRSPLYRFVSQNPITALFIAAMALVALYYIHRLEIKFKNPENLYQKALTEPYPLDAIRLLEMASKFYHPKAKMLLANLYISFNRFDDAFKLVEKLQLGESAYIQGLIFSAKNDPAKARQKFVIASLRGYVPAYSYAGTSFLPHDKKTAAAYFERGVKEEDPDCMVALSSMLMFGGENQFSREDSLRALDLIKRAAKLNSIDACNTLSRLFIMGLHNELDENVVRERLEYAVDKKDKDAILSKGMQKLYGSLLYLKNPEEGIIILKTLINNKTAFLHIGKYYLSQNNRDEAVKWFTNGAAHDHPECLYQLYLLTNNINYLKRAAELKHSEALFKLAVFAMKDNNIEAYSEYLQKSASAGNLNAMFQFAKILSLKHYEDESAFEKVVSLLNRLGNKFSDSYFVLYNFYNKHGKMDNAIEALVKGASVDHLGCMKELYAYHKQMPEEMGSAELLFRRIRAREPDFMAEIADVEEKDFW